MTRNAIVDALGVLKAGRIVDLTHLVHPGIQRFGPFPAMRIETRYTVAESDDGVAHCPGWGLDALEYLFEERGVTAVGHETLDTDGSADVRARGARLREVRARVRSLSGRGHGEPRQAALDGRRDLRGPPEVRQVPGLPGPRMGGRAQRGLSAADALAEIRL